MREAASIRRRAEKARLQGADGRGQDGDGVASPGAAGGGAATTGAGRAGVRVDRDEPAARAELKRERNSHRTVKRSQVGLRPTAFAATAGARVPRDRRMESRLPGGETNWESRHLGGEKCGNAVDGGEGRAPARPQHVGMSPRALTIFRDTRLRADAGFATLPVAHPRKPMGLGLCSNFGGFPFLMNIAYTKPALTVEAQLRLLESRGMTIEDRAFAERALATVSYYRLSAYSFPYRSSSSTTKTKGSDTDAPISRNDSGTVFVL